MCNKKKENSYHSAEIKIFTSAKTMRPVRSSSYGIDRNAAKIGVLLPSSFIKNDFSNLEKCRRKAGHLFLKARIIRTRTIAARNGNVEQAQVYAQLCAVVNDLR